MSKSATVDEITKAFTFQTIPKVNGQPTYETIAAIHAKLKVNAASIITPLGGGMHGHLGLVLPRNTYHTVANAHFNRPANPGIHPVIEPNATQARIAEINRQHQANIKMFTECNNTDTALKNLLISAIDEQYIKTLHDEHTGYVTSTTWQILEFLYTNHGNITPADLQANTEKLKEPYNPSEPIENLYSRFEEAMKFADAANRPYTTEQILDNALLCMLKTGQFKEACRDWRRNPNQTWATFNLTLHKVPSKTHQTMAPSMSKAHSSDRSLQQHQKQS